MIFNFLSLLFNNDFIFMQQKIMKYSYFKDVTKFPRLNENYYLMNSIYIYPLYIDSLRFRIHLGAPLIHRKTRILYVDRKNDQWVDEM